MREVVDAPSIVTVYGYIGQGFEQSDLAKNVLSYCRAVGLDDL